MANICYNKFTLSEENENHNDYQEVKNKLNELLNTLRGDLDEIDEGVCEGFFDSKWTFPAHLIGPIIEGKEVYFRCLSEEYGCCYVAMNVYSDGYWHDEQCFDF